MQVTIKGQKVNLNKKEVELCRKQVSEIINSVKKATQKGHRITYFFTFLIIMHVLSGNMLDEMDAETLSKLMQILNKK